jgi:hypothetical protein
MSCDDPKRLFINATFCAASTWVLDKLLSAYEARMNDAAWEFYNTVEGSRDAATLQGKIWERQVHNFVSSRTNPLTLTAISLEGQPATPLTLDVPVGLCRRSFNFQSFLGILEDAIQKRTPSYLVPLVPNFATIDSLFYKPDEPFRAIQITKAPRHPVDVTGFKRIQQWMKPKSLASPLRPSAAKPWHFVFVVPSGADIFSKQSLTGTGTDVGVWGKKIQQFVVELPKEEVLKTSSHLRAQSTLASPASSSAKDGEGEARSRRRIRTGKKRARKSDEDVSSEEGDKEGAGGKSVSAPAASESSGRTLRPRVPKSTTKVLEEKDKAYRKAVAR